MTSLAPLGLGLLALLLTVALVPLVRRWARRVGLLDDPAAGAYKTHRDTVPYGGGLAIFTGAALPLAAGFAYVAVSRWDFVYFQGQWADLWAPVSLYPGLGLRLTLRQLSQIACLAAGGTAMFLVGLIDDWRGLGALPRLAAQLAVAVATVAAVPQMHLVGAGPGVVSATVTAIWIVAFTNAFNFLDNMNGLAGGLAVVVLSLAGGVAALLGHLPAAVLCLTLVGACGGFLVYNFPRASIFMGDAGGLLLGFTAGALTSLLSNLTAAATGDGAHRFAPLVILALPAYDLVTVVATRLYCGRPPWLGDTNHISHRLVRLGLSRRGAVLVIYALALTVAATGLLALFLPPPLAWLPLASSAIWLAALGCLDAWGARRRSHA